MNVYPDIPVELEDHECDLLLEHRRLDINSGKEFLGGMIESVYVEHYYHRIPTNILDHACFLCTLNRKWEEVKMTIRKKLLV